MSEEEMAETKVTHESDSWIRLSTGVVLVAKPANPFVMLTVMSMHPRPEPPRVFIEVMGRQVENLDDPDYIGRVKAWQQEQSAATLDAMILYGTELRDVPKGFPKPDSDEWLKKYHILKLESDPDNKDWRYLTWVKFVAIQSLEDLDTIKNVVGKLSGVREADVKTAETFPGRDKK